MKKLTTIFCAFIVLLTVVSARSYFDESVQTSVPTQGAAAFAVLEQNEWHFGSVDNDSLLTAKFPIKNIGGRRLIIYQQSSSCECVSSDLEPIIINPGGSLELVANLDTHNLDGSYMMDLNFQTNAPNLPRFKLILFSQVHDKSIHSAAQPDIQ